MALKCWLVRSFLSVGSLLLVVVSLLSVATTASAQYVVTNLVSNQNANGTNPADPLLVNAWGITSTATSPFWLGDEGTGKSTIYNSAGQKQALVVTVPPAPGGTVGSPTGVITNSTGQFKITANGKTASPAFIFATLDGTISGWSPAVDATHAVIGADRSKFAASYTALAIVNDVDGTFIYAADNSANAEIDVFDINFAYKGSFTDRSVPRKFTPYGMREINGKLWVAYTPLNKGQDGLVDIFNLDGTLFKHDAVHGPLHSPWAFALAPGDFGKFSNAILIGNNTKDGRINAFDPDSGMFLGTLTDASGQPIVIDQLWGLDFGKGGGGNGALNELFFTAGSDEYADGLFGVITVAP